ncbi:MAG: hypothetical protein LAT76_10900 [Schleiferiaceae bacterium]|nr:hypothetical protein [Schleiferiaceae bacterium]
MNKLFYFALFLGVMGWDVQGQSFQERATTSSNMRLNVTNLGTFGNAFRGYRDGSGNASCEYPAGSGIEHLFEGGLWVGGVENGNTVRVSTSAIDAPQGYAPGRAGFEFTAPMGATLAERSTLFDSPFYSPNAVSHQDYVATFTDANVTIPGLGTPIQNHNNPMNLEMTMETYNWNYSFSDFMVIVNVKIKNIGQNFFDSLHVGLWNNTVVRNINITPAGAGGAVFFQQGGNGFMDSLDLAYCFDATGDVGFTDSYIGQKFLGSEDKYGFHHPLLDSTFNPMTGQWEPERLKTHYNAWQFNSPGTTVYFTPSSDQLRFQKMASGFNHSPCWDDPLGGPCQLDFSTDLQDDLRRSGNRSDLLSVGPFRRFEPGDEIEISFAYIVAPKRDDGNPNAANTPEQREILVSNANWAQTAYNGEDVNFNGILDPGEDTDGDGKITRFILPAPPDIPRTKIVTRENAIDVYWSNNAEFSVDPITGEEDFEGYRVYMTKFGFDVIGPQNLQRDLIKIAEYDIPDNGFFFETGFESVKLPMPVTFDNDPNEYFYKYTIENIPNGWQYAIAVSAFDRGNPETNLESLESSLLANNFRAFPGTKPVEDMDADEPFVYPNPYYAGASWEGRSAFQEESRKLIFANLPKKCMIRIYTVAGDFIDQIYHDDNYDGTDIRWFRTFGSEGATRNVFSGGEHAWDLLTENSQIISRGLYMFSVEDLETGAIKTGKFVIIK